MYRKSVKESIEPGDIQRIKGTLREDRAIKNKTKKQVYRY